MIKIAKELNICVDSLSRHVKKEKLEKSKKIVEKLKKESKRRANEILIKAEIQADERIANQVQDYVSCYDSGLRRTMIKRESRRVQRGRTGLPQRPNCHNPANAIRIMSITGR